MSDCVRAGRILVVMAALLAAGLTGCGNGVMNGDAERRERSPTEAVWVLPVEGLRWGRARLLAVLAFPLDEDLPSVQVYVNGRDRTAPSSP